MDKKNNLLILSLTFSPDNVSTAQIMAGLSEDLLLQGNNVKVITTTPHFNRDLSMEEKQPLNWLLWPFLKKSTLNGVTAYHIPMPRKSIWPPLRMLSWIWFHAVSVFVALFIGRINTIIACSPPLTIGLAAWAIAKLKRAKYIYNVQELYPDIAVNLGKMKGKSIIRFFEKVERFIYRHALYVTSITEGMCKKIRERTNPEKVKLIPNYVEIDEDHIPLNIPHEKFTLCYAGNMGVPQYLEVMVDVAKLRPDVRVLFVGEGQDKDRLKKLAHELTNVEFRDYIPLSEMPKLYAESDLFYVGQDPLASSDGIPSKIYRILGQRKPLAVVTAKGSDLEKFVIDSKGGIAVNSAEELAQAITDKETFAQMGIDGFDYVKTRYAKQVITNQYASLVGE
ncbi:MAG: glycosyltransferase family 4 protein [Kiritimatiellae bacterium]|nr:glycosyltransferase family 4 protein [Kiritimatiellia bacterium]